MLTAKNIALLRDSAIQIESHNLQMAHDLMELAHQARPDGPFIKKKLKNYKAELAVPDRAERTKLKQLVESGDIAIIPVGFRCNTKGIIAKKLGIRQVSHPFDSGFFSPNSVASVLQAPTMGMSFEGLGIDHAVCIKTEENKDAEHGLGVQFSSATYNYINAKVTSEEIPDINKYLDSTFGYYTLNINHQFVLAHYNWHPLSNIEKSKGVTDPRENLKAISDLMEKRVSRMMDSIRKAKHVIFIFSESQNYQYLQIDKKFDLLGDFEQLKTVCTDKWGENFTIVKNINDGNFTAKDALKCLD